MTIWEYKPPTWRNRVAHRREVRRMARGVMPGDGRAAAGAVCLLLGMLCLALLLVPALCRAEGQAPPLMTVRVEAGSSLNIREEPDAEARSCGRLKAGTVVAVLEERDGWARVDWPVCDGSGRGMGWVCMAYLAEE